MTDEEMVFGFVTTIKVQRARKAHDCVADHVIAPGEMYGSQAFVIDGQGWTTNKFCSDCCTELGIPLERGRYTNWNDEIITVEESERRRAERRAIADGSSDYFDQA